jgi:lipopolysaccharide/colanic/teichoic acid biosynthesis glycosyltransferase
MDEDEKRNVRERRKRNIAIGLALAGLVVLFFVMTMVRLKGHVFDWTS